VLSGQLVTAWTNFMYTGNPNLKGDQPWPRYTKDSQIYLSQNVPRSSAIAAAEFAAAHKCAFWDTVLIY
jgi:para-nitrobenzyl esterase